MVASTVVTRSVVNAGSPRRTVPAAQRDRVPLLIVLLALLLFLPAFGWGIPHATAVNRTHSWGNDDLVPLAPLAEMYNTFVHVEPHRNVAYPWFQYFLDAVVAGPYIVYLLLTGQMHRGSPQFPFGLTNPEAAFRNITWFGRTVSLLLGIAVPLGAYYTGKYLWDRRAGFAAALFALLMFPLAYYARLGNLDAPVLGWTSLGLAAYALVLASGLTTKRAVAFSTFVALAVATKDQAAGSFLLLVPILIGQQLLRIRQEGWRAGSIWKPLFAMGGAFAFVYLLASGAVVDRERFIEHTAKVIGVGSGSIPLYNRYPATAAGYQAHFTHLLLFLVEVMSWPVILLAIAGAVFAALRDRRGLTLLLSSLGFLAMLMPVLFGRIHYLLPVALPLTILAGYGFSRLYELAGRWSKLVLAYGIAAAGFLVLQSIDLTHDMIRDSRYAAGDWLDAHTRPGDQVMFFGADMKNPRLKADVLSVKIEARADALPTILQKKPEIILVSPEDTNEDRLRVEWRSGPHSVYSDYIPGDVFAKLADGSLGYRLVAQFQTPRLMPWLPRPFLSYSTVNPPVQIFVRDDRAGSAPRLQAWLTAPHYPKPRKTYEPKHGRSAKTGEIS